MSYWSRYANVCLPDALSLNNGPHTLFELDEISLGQGVRLGDDRNEIATRAETLHNLNVERFQPENIKQRNDDKRQYTYV
jgi:hypothetical protein